MAFGRPVGQTVALVVAETVTIHKAVEQEQPVRVMPGATVRILAVAVAVELVVLVLLAAQLKQVVRGLVLQ